MLGFLILFLFVAPGLYYSYVLIELVLFSCPSSGSQSSYLHMITKNTFEFIVVVEGFDWQIVIHHWHWKNSLQKQAIMRVLKYAGGVGI